MFKSYDDKWSSYELDIMAQMSTIIEIVFSALHKCSKDWRKPFHVNISDPKNKISEYWDKWSDMINQLKSVENGPIETNTKENNDILDKLSIIEWLIRNISTLSSKPQKKTTKKEKQIEVEQVSEPVQTAINLMNLIPNLDEEYAR